jgi:hypothetical protein
MDVVTAKRKIPYRELNPSLPVRSLVTITTQPYRLLYLVSIMLECTKKRGVLYIKLHTELINDYLFLYSQSLFSNFHYFKILCISGPVLRKLRCQVTDHCT